MAAEAKLEQKLRLSVKALGGVALKFTSPGFTGLPDRIVLMPGGKLYFVEMKAPTGVISARQGIVHTLLNNLGFSVEVISNDVELSGFINYLKKIKYGY